LGASLSSLIIQSEYLLQLAGDEKLRREIADLKTSAEESIEELRRSLRMMREDFELASVLDEYVRTLKDRTQLDISFRKTGLEPRLPPDTQLTLFRVLQEALSNCVRHAGARRVEVSLLCGEDRVALEVRDDGKGFDPQAPRPGHYGLLNMRERARKSRGELSIESAEGRGTTVRLAMPTRS
jgi:signal transduction histidine kinase